MHFCVTWWTEWQRLLHSHSCYRSQRLSAGTCSFQTSQQEHEYRKTVCHHVQASDKTEGEEHFRYVKSSSLFEWCVWSQCSDLQWWKYFSFPAVGWKHSVSELSDQRLPPPLEPLRHSQMSFVWAVSSTTLKTMKSFCVSGCGVTLWDKLIIGIKQSENINLFKQR